MPEAVLTNNSRVQANRSPFRVPTRAQRSGACGKTTNSGRSKKSPKAVASDLKLVRRTEALRHKTFFFCRARHFLLMFQKKMWRILCGKAAISMRLLGATQVVLYIHFRFC